MEISFKEAGVGYLDTLTDLRIEFIADIHPDYPAELLNKIRNASYEYFEELLRKGLYTGFLGLDSSERIVCTAGLLIYYLPPLNDFLPRKIGHILNFYTKKQFRNKGYGLKLMEYIKETSKKNGITRLVLNATTMGYPLYQKAGFIEPEEKGMIFDF